MIGVDMSFEFSRKRAEQGEPEDGGTFSSALGKGMGILGSLMKRGERPERVEKKILSGVASAVSEFRERGGPVKPEELVEKIISGLPQEQFPGIKSLRESDPGAISELSQELLGVVNTGDDAGRRRKSTEIIEKYNIIGEKDREIRQILGVIGSLRVGASPDGFSSEELGAWQKNLEEARGRKPGAKERLWSAGGFLGKLLLFSTIFLIFLQYKLTKFALEKATGIKSKKQK